MDLAALIAASLGCLVIVAGVTVGVRGSRRGLIELALLALSLAFIFQCVQLTGVMVG